MKTFRCSTRFILDKLALMEARRRRYLRERVRCSNYSGSWSDMMWMNVGDGTAVANTGAETSMLAGLSGNEQPIVPALHFCGQKAMGKTVRFEACGLFSNTLTPTMQFFGRISPTGGTGTLSGAILGQSKANATASGVTNQMWWGQITAICRQPGVGSGQATLSCDGWIASPGFSTAGLLPMEVGAPDSATHTVTIQADLQNYLNWSLTWGTANASNTATLIRAVLLGLN